MLHRTRVALSLGGGLCQDRLSSGELIELAGTFFPVSRYPKQDVQPEPTLKKRLLVSIAAPNRGALTPRYKLHIPSCLSDCLKQSSGPV